MKGIGDFLRELPPQPLDVLLQLLRLLCGVLEFLPNKLWEIVCGRFALLTLVTRTTEQHPKLDYSSACSR